MIPITANFSDLQRKDTLEAASYAGLNVVKPIDEPTASLMSSQTGATSVVVNDICPFDISVSTNGREMSPILTKGSMWGSSNTQTYPTMYHYQTTMVFDVYEGCMRGAKYNIRPGHFEISRIPSKLQGEVSVEVRFTLNRNGMLGITATCPRVRTKSL